MYSTLQQSVRMKVELLWDSRCSGVREPLYLVWLGRGTYVCQTHQSLNLDTTKTCLSL